MNEDELVNRLKPKILRWVENAVGNVVGAPSPHDLFSSHHTGSLADAQAPQFLKVDGSRQLTGNLTVGNGITIDGVDLSAFKSLYDTHAANPAATAHSGVGTHTHQSVPEGSTLDHGLALSGLGDDDHPHYVHNTSARTITAVHTFSPGSATAPFILGANGQGQTVVGLRADQLNKSVSAGNGLTGGGTLTASQTLTLGTPSTLNATTTNAVTATSHTHAVTASANPGAAESILKTTSAGGVTLVTAAITGAATVGQDLTVGANVLFVDQSEGIIGVNRVPDPQFALDINGNLRTSGFIVGKHALQIKDAKLIAHYDGPEPFQTNFTGEPTGHMGQPATVSGGVIYRAGRFQKALQMAEATTNLATNPVFGNASATAGSTALTAYPTTSLNTVDKLYGAQSLQLVFDGAASVKGIMWSAAGTTGQVYTVSLWYKVTAYTSGTLHFDCTYPAAGDTTDTDVSAVTSEWQRLTFTVTLTGNGNVNLRCFANSTGGYFAGTVLIDGVQIELKNYPTPLVSGDLGAGHSWAGTAHASTSSRTVGMLSYNATGNIDLSAGTVSLWFYNDGITRGAVRRAWYFYIDGNNRFAINVENNSAVKPFAASVSGGVNASTDSGSQPTAPVGWNHLCATWKAGGLLQFYLNGVLSGNTPSYTAPVGTGGTIYVGRDSSTTTQHLNDLLDDLVIVGRELTDDEVRAIYESDAPVFAESSTWQFKSTSQLVWADAEGLWAIDNNGNAAFGVSGVDGKSWGGATLDRGDILLGRGTTYAKWDSSAATMQFQGDGAGVTNINGGNIQTGTVTASKINVNGTITIQAGGSLIAGTATNGIVFNDTLIKGVSDGVTQFEATASDGKLYAGAGSIILDANGITAVPTSGSSLIREYKFSSGGTNYARWGVYFDAFQTISTLKAIGAGSRTAMLTIEADADNTGTQGQVIISAGSGAGSSVIEIRKSSTEAGTQINNLSVGTGMTLNLTDGDLRYTGALIARRSSTNYTGYIYVPMITAGTSTSFDGDAYSTTAATDYTASSVFGVPANAKAIFVRIAARDSGSVNNSTVNVIMQAKGGTSAPILCRPAGLPNDYWAEISGICPLDANGQFTLTINASGASTLDLFIQVHGYFI